MKKIALFLLFCFAISSAYPMVRAGVQVAPDDPYYGDPYYGDPYYYGGWYGPGMYYGVYFSDYPSYYAWRRQYYYGGPYYWRWNNYPRHGEYHHHHDGKHHK